MIISFSVTNWKSFKDETKWVFVPTKSKRHHERIAKIGNLKISPIAGLFGPNSAGKTNLLDGLELMKRLVLKNLIGGPNSIHNLSPYLFECEKKIRPTTFVLEMLIDEKVHELSISFILNPMTHLDSRVKSFKMGHIIEEKLTIINKNDETCLYHRQYNSQDNTKGYYTTNFSLDRSHHLTDIDILRSLADSTKECELFLSLSDDIDTKLPDYLPIIRWFDSLTFGRPYNFEKDLPTFNNEIFNVEEINEYLSLFETDIKILEESKKDGGFSIIKKNDNGQDIVFKIDFLSTEERDLIAFLIYISLVKKTKTVLVLDGEFNNFHSELTKSLLLAYLKQCNNDTRAQLIFTSHDQSIMDQSLLRLDEMWLIEKLKNQSDLYSCFVFENLNENSDVAKRYRQLYLGAYPIINLPF